MKKTQELLRGSPANAGNFASVDSIDVPFRKLHYVRIGA